MKLNSLQELFLDQLKDLYSAEAQITKALPKMVKNACSDQLRQALGHHLEETRGQVERLNRIGEILGMRLTGKKCHAMEGLLEEGKEVLEADGEDEILDAAMIAAAQKVEHYEIASYGTVRTLAEQLGLQEVARLLSQTLEEESAANEKLTSVAESEIYPRVKANQQQGEMREQQNGTSGQQGETGEGQEVAGAEMSETGAPR